MLDQFAVAFGRGSPRKLWQRIMTSSSGTITMYQQHLGHMLTKRANLISYQLRTMMHTCVVGDTAIWAIDHKINLSSKPLQPISIRYSQQLHILTLTHAATFITYRRVTFTPEVFRDQALKFYWDLLPGSGPSTVTHPFLGPIIPKHDLTSSI